LALLTALVILPLGWILEPPAGLSVSAWHALVVLLAALPALVLDALLESVVALLITSAWVGFGITAPGIALSGFANPNWVFVVVALIIAATISSTGLLYRLALEVSPAFAAGSRVRCWPRHHDRAHAAGPG
jgi:divalent anion:Na+ symporter, DASS family